jgi:aconitate hydratase
VRAVVAKSFERIHRSNLVGMGVLPLQFSEGRSAADLGLDGSEVYSIEGVENDITPGMTVQLVVERGNGERISEPLKVRIDTGIEVAYYRNGGILPYVLRNLLR